MQKLVMDARRQLMQDEFRRETGLIIDKPRAGGAGNTTNGNTARRFFEDTATASRITGNQSESWLFRDICQFSNNINKHLMIFFQVSARNSLID